MPSVTRASCSHSSLSAARGTAKGHVAAATIAGREQKKTVVYGRLGSAPGQSPSRAASLAFRGETLRRAAVGGAHSQKFLLREHLDPGDACAPWASRPRSGPPCALRARALLSVSCRRRDSMAAHASSAALSYARPEAPGRGTWRGGRGLWAGAPLPPLQPAETRGGD